MMQRGRVSLKSCGLGLALVLSAAVSGMVPTAASEPLPSETAEGTTLEGSEALEASLPSLPEGEALTKDAAEFAKSTGKSQEAAEEALSAARDLIPFVGDIRAVIGDREVFIGKVYEPDTHLVVEVSGSDPIPGLDQIVEAAPHPILVSYVDRPGVEGMHSILRAATSTWQQHYPQITRTTVDDADHSSILIFVQDGEEYPSEPDLRALAPRIPNAINISLRHEPDGEGAAKASRGGLRLNLQSKPSGGAKCTSGFMATRNVSGTKVLLTTGHCPDALAYRGWFPGQIDTNMNFGGEIDNAEADAQFHYTSGIGSDQFWDGAAYRSVTDVILRTHLTNGDYVCKFGRNSHYGCGFVLSIYSAFQGDHACNFGPCDNVWLAITMDEIVGGDSGGPAFIGTSAIGFIAGYTLDYDVFTSISYPRARLDVTLIGE